MRARSLSVVPLIALVAGALAGSAGAQAPLPPPVSADSVAACRAECEWIACGESPPEPVVGTDSLGALLAPAAYPSDGDGTEGRVIVRFIVRADGTTDAVEVARGLTPALDSAAVRLVRPLAWRPARQPCWGPAVEARFALPVTFRRPRP